jgi:hypothetical protein
VLDLTKDELKAKPEYKYSNAGWRGQVFSDKSPWTAGDPNRMARDRAASEGMSADRNTASTTSTGDFNAKGEISGNAFIGTTSATKTMRPSARSRTSISTIEAPSKR